MKLVVGASLAVFAFAIGNVGCRGAPPARSGAAYDRTRISPEEIEAAVHVPNAYELVRRLRPQWLSSRGQDSFRQPSRVVIYVDEQRSGGAQALRQLRLTLIEDIRYLDARLATQRFGIGHGAGAIMIRTRS